MFVFSLSSERILSEIMRDIKKWMDCKQLKMNENKTECIVIGKKGDVQRLGGLQSLDMNGKTVTVSDKVTSLGVIIDRNMNLNDQINDVVRKARFHLWNIGFIRKYLDEKTVKMLIHSQVISRLDYCNSLYYNLPKCQLKKLQLVMNKAARIIKRLPSYVRITPTLIDLHWLPVKARIMYKICVLTYQALKTGKPEYLKTMLRHYEVATNMVIRHAADEYRLNEPRCNSEIGARAFMYSAPRLFNALPIQIKTSANVAVFKKRLKTHLFTECYDLEDKVINEMYIL